MQPRQFRNVAVECLGFRHLLSLVTAKPEAADTWVLQQLRYLLQAHAKRRGRNPVINIHKDICRGSTNRHLIQRGRLLVILQGCPKSTDLVALCRSLRQLVQRPQGRYHRDKIKRGLLLLTVLVCPLRRRRRTGARITLLSVRRSRPAAGRRPRRRPGPARGLLVHPQ